MQSATHRTRPYRSRAVPACQSCRARKSRCKLEDKSTTCLMCRIYNTECVFQDAAGGNQPRDSSQASETSQIQDQDHQVQQVANPLSEPSRVSERTRLQQQTSETSYRIERDPQPLDTRQTLGSTETSPLSSGHGTARTNPADVVPVPVSSSESTGRKRRRLESFTSQASNNTSLSHSLTSPALTLPITGSVAQQVCPPPGSQTHYDLSSVSQPTPLSVYDKDQDNSHIVGPANTNDSQVLTDYLSCVHGTSSGMRLVRMMPTSWSKPVMFTPVQHRTFGKSSTQALPYEKLHIMEKMIGKHIGPLTDVFFVKANKCLPLLEPSSFLTQYRNAKDKISPALLACLYAHSVTYWQSSPQLREVPPPDHQFLWSLASDALYAELHTAPGISTIIALLLDLGGRPTTSLIANAVLLGSAVSLAHSLGLNRNPLQWDIPDGEKLLRMKIWWCLVIHDTWLSFAYGTPPHIVPAQSDVPGPEASFFNLGDQQEGSTDAIAVFMALSGLSGVLDSYLRYLYHIRDDQSGPGSIEDLELKLNHWIDSLRPDTRRIITRGSDLRAPGAANLRLSYLSIRFLLCRLKLDQGRERKGTDFTTLGNRYMQVQSTAEDIVIFIQELDDEQLNDFWFPMSAFTFTSVTTALLRFAVETKGSQAAAGQNTSLQLAWDMILALRNLRDRVGWDLGEHCLQQYSSVVEKLIEVPGTGLETLVFQGFEGTIEDALAFDGEFSNLWAGVAPGV